MKIAVRRGHQYTGRDGAAAGLVREIEVAERYYKLVIKKLQSLGHEVMDVTPPEANRSLENSLMYGINMANAFGVDLFVSCHVDNCYESYNGSLGCEVIYCPGSSKGAMYAERVEKELANLGFKSRGAKEDVRGLAEIHHTNMPCIIIEPFFVEATEDVATYNVVGDEGMANAIVKGITGQTVSNSNVSSDFIKSVQHDLQRLGCLEAGEANATGILDAKTKAAIRQVRNIVGLPDGENIDSQLTNALNVITKKPTIGKGWPSNPIATKFIQWWLGAPKTGIFDDITVQKVKEWQKAAKIYWDPDGVIRIESWNKILK